MYYTQHTLIYFFLLISVYLNQFAVWWNEGQAAATTPPGSPSPLGPLVLETPPVSPEPTPPPSPPLPVFIEVSAFEQQLLLPFMQAELNIPGIPPNRVPFRDITPNM